MNAPFAPTAAQDRTHLVQDLRAAAHTVHPEAARLMRSAAAWLEADGSLLDAEPQAAPFPPPSDNQEV